MKHRVLIEIDDGGAALCPVCRDAPLRTAADHGAAYGRLRVECEGVCSSRYELVLEDTGAGVMVAAYMRPRDAAVALLRKAAVLVEQAERAEAEAGRLRPLIDDLYEASAAAERAMPGE